MIKKYLLSLVILLGCIQVSQAIPVRFTITGSLSPFKTCVGTPSAAQSFIVRQAFYAPYAAIVTAPSGFEISTDSINYSGSLSFANSIMNNVRIYVRLHSATSGPYTGNVTFTISSLTASRVSATGIVYSDMSASLSSQTVACYGSTNGSATVSVSGGSGGYLYAWSPSGGTAATAQGLGAGNYICLITDSSTCSVRDTVVINSNPAIVTSVSSQTNVSCYLDSSGSVTIYATGGTGPYTYAWSPIGGASPTASGLPAGTFTCIVTDANNCTAGLQSTISQPSQGLRSGFSTMACDSYSWNNQTYTSTGSYQQTLTSVSGCDSLVTLTLTVNATSTSTTSLSICSSDLPYSWNGLTFSSGGSQTAHLTNSSGCDSAATLNLTIRPISTSTTNLSIPAVQLPYRWNGLTFTTAGSQTAHLTNSAGCDSAATLNLTIPAVNTWTGAVSTAWSAAGNWSMAVPAAGTDALIPGGLIRYPIVSAAASVNNLTIQPRASISVSSGITLNVYGNWTDSGTAVVGAGTVALRGTTTFFGSTVFTNLTVAGNATIGANASDKISVSGMLIKSSGTLNTNGKLTLISTSTQTALVADSGGALSGNATIQKYIPGYTGYHEISSPLSGSTVANLTGFGIVGANGAAGWVLGQGGSLTEYRESANIYNTLDSGYYNYTTASNPLTSGMGFAAKMGGGVTISFTGVPANGNYSYHISNLGSNIKTAGWNLVGNPYPSPIRWSSVKAANPGIMNATCYIWKPSSATTGTWQAYNGTYGTNGVGDLLGLGQGFFVLKTATGTSSLSFDNSMRTLNLSAVSYKDNIAPDEIRLTLTAGDNTAEALSYTEEGRSLGFDEDADGLLPAVDGMNVTSLAFVSKGAKYLINVIDNINENLEMPVAIHTNDPGTYTISAASLNVSAYPVYLLDKSTNTYHEIATKDVTFNSEGNEDKTNYSVVFKKVSATTPTDVINVYGKTGAIVVQQSAVQTPSTITVTNTLGQEVIKTTTTESRITLPIEVSAIYLVSVKQNGIEITKKVFVDK